MKRIQRKICTARLEDPQHDRQKINAPLGKQRNKNIRAYAILCQNSGKTIRMAVQFVISSLFRPEHCCCLIRDLANLFFKQFMKGCVFRNRSLCIVPFHKQLMTLCFCQKRKFAHRTGRVGNNFSEECQIMPCKTLYPFLAEQISSVLKLEMKFIADVQNVQDQIIFCMIHGQIRLLKFQARHFRKTRKTIQIEFKRNHGPPAQILGQVQLADQPGKRILLMLIRLNKRLLRIVKIVVKRLGKIHTAVKRNKMGAVAHQLFASLKKSSRTWKPDQHLLISCDPVNQSGIGRDHRHKGCASP